MNIYKFKLLIDKDKYWYLNDGFHRDYDRPAIIGSNGAKSWCQHGNHHRDNDKPALIGSTGTKWWLQYGENHRANDKPAIIWCDGGMEYWVNGEHIYRVIKGCEGV